jgi:hypothetical protein
MTSVSSSPAACVNSARPFGPTRRRLRKRDNLLKVNGYNEAFTGWGREDSELAVRLMNTGARRLDVRGWAICYHLWHRPVSRAKLPANDQLLQTAQEQEPAWCTSGLNTHLPKTAH